MSEQTMDVSIPLDKLSGALTACLQEGQEVVLTITGYSMTPLLKHRRDQVVLGAVDGSQLCPGDVPLYRRRDGVYVLHRVVARDDGERCTYIGGTEQASTSLSKEIRYTMLGDAQTDLEIGIVPSQIIARAVAFVRRGKRIDCESSAYRRYVRWWYHCLFAREQLLWLYRLPQRIVRKCRSLVGK